MIGRMNRPKPRSAVPVPATDDPLDADLDADDHDGPSKSQRKRDSTALQDLGAKLVALPHDQFRRIDLPDALRDAVAEARRLTKHGALRRQLQYVGRVMRHVDAAPIRAQIDVFEGVAHEATAALHRLERWRERLLADPDALSELVALHPDVDIQALRTRIRNARRERETGRPPKAFRELFQQLRALFGDAGSLANPPAHGDADDDDVDLEADDGDDAAFDTASDDDDADGVFDRAHR
jgi:ribosome-associated protein